MGNPDPRDQAELNSKLVRDRIPELAQARGQTITVERLDDDTYLLALLAKLLEEALELVESQSVKEMVKELADVDEVVRALARLLGGPETLEAVRQAKAAERGGFEGRLFMTWEAP